MQADETNKPSNEISKIDGKPIININEADFYDSDLLSEFRDKLAASHGRAIIQAINEQFTLSESQSTPLVAVKDLDDYATVKGTKTNGNITEIGSSHLRIHREDGETEDYVLTLRPYQKSPSQVVTKGAGEMNKLSAANTYLALSPDRFYLQDDENGNEQWPITFPAVSLEDPTNEITVTFNKEGLVSTSLDKSKATNQSSEPQLVLMEGTSASTSDCDETSIDCGGGSGGGSEHPEYQGIDSYILSIKTIRLDGTGDGDNASELQMHVDPVPSEGFSRFERKWEYAFDRKYGEKGLPVTFGDGGFFKVLGALLLFITDNDLFRSIETGSIFEGMNSRTYGLDMRIYETPDVDNELVNYNFTNMRTWEERLPFPPDIQIDYEEVAATDYFPAVLLNSSTFRVLLMEDDTDYPEASGNEDCFGP